ncbi:hypothetical protein FSP39_001436 [Pinctada imbricata]|uniref:Uncharacterized protein n=1 Tax=Pinctada imbricata TaxID=66713 RepID=A0AA89BN81_PINIB|nr:hypothetical protein FSP39_001436 [Pinctada imbricata]
MCQSLSSIGKINQTILKVRSIWKPTKKLQKKAARNQVVCEAEINTCVQRNENEYVTMEIVAKREGKMPKIYSDGLNLDSIMESDVSYDTVIDKDARKKDIEDMTRETGDLALADSGFCSPRVVEGQSPSNDNNEIQSRVEEIKKASNSSLCPKNVYQKSDDGSHTSDHELPVHDKENRHKMLNNMKFVPQERSVLTHYNQVQHYSNNTDAEPRFLQQIPFKFNFDDDYEVVGVV